MSGKSASMHWYDLGREAEGFRDQYAYGGHDFDDAKYYRKEAADARAEVERLRAALEHCESEAGSDSCAAVLRKNERLRLALGQVRDRAAYSATNPTEADAWLRHNYTVARRALAGCVWDPQLHDWVPPRGEGGE